MSIRRNRFLLQGRLGRVRGRPLTNEMSPVCRGGPRGRPLIRVLSGVLTQFNPAAGAALVAVR